MTTMESRADSAHATNGSGATDSGGGAIKPLFDLAAIDLKATIADREVIARFNPHRAAMALVDRIVWLHNGGAQGLGIKHVRDDEFWCAGHFPGNPVFPGVLQLEAAAQLACYLYNIRRPQQELCVFTRIDECTFRRMVRPGDDLVMLCQDIKFSRRRFMCDVQGWVGDQVTFTAKIAGMSLASS